MKDSERKRDLREKSAEELKTELNALLKEQFWQQDARPKQEPGRRSINWPWRTGNLGRL